MVARTLAEGRQNKSFWQLVCRRQFSCGISSSVLELCSTRLIVKGTLLPWLSLRAPEAGFECGRYFPSRQAPRRVGSFIQSEAPHNNRLQKWFAPDRLLKGKEGKTRPKSLNVAHQVAHLKNQQTKRPKPLMSVCP
ncbi:hypothetical protein VTK56DRAFT_3048 [Thermocarpiscus australiensis]